MTPFIPKSKVYLLLRQAFDQELFNEYNGMILILCHWIHSQNYVVMILILYHISWLDASLNKLKYTLVIRIEGVLQFHNYVLTYCGKRLDMYSP
jgi:hypothetical protein